MKIGAKMDTVATILWIAVIGILVFSLLWFLVGSTAFFQRSPDLPLTVWYIIFWVPVLIFTIAIVSVLVLKQDWILKVANTAGTQRVMALVLLPIAVSSAVGSIHLTPTSGWLSERVQGDVTQITPDEKYEYRAEVVNQFQKNAFVRLYVMDVSTGEKTVIRLDAKPEEISARLTPHPLWSFMNPTEQPKLYQLYIPDGFGSLLVKKAVFEIDIVAKSSRRIE